MLPPYLSAVMLWGYKSLLSCADLPCEATLRQDICVRAERQAERSRDMRCRAKGGKTFLCSVFEMTKTFCHLWVNTSLLENCDLL